MGSGLVKICSRDEAKIEHAKAEILSLIEKNQVRSTACSRPPPCCTPTDDLTSGYCGTAVGRVVGQGVGACHEDQQGHRAEGPLRQHPPGVNQSPGHMASPTPWTLRCGLDNKWLCITLIFYHMGWMIGEPGHRLGQRHHPPAWARRGHGGGQGAPTPILGYQ